MPATIIYREPLPDGTVKVWERQENGSVTSFVVGTPRNRTQEAVQNLAPYKELYADPWYQEFVLGPQNRATERAYEAQQFGQGLQERGMALNERTGAANIRNQRDLLELRKDELRQQLGLQNRGYDIQERGQNLQANLALAQMRGAGNAAQFIDAARRLRSFGTQTGSLAQIAAGGMPTGGAFGTGYGMQPISMQDRMSGMLGTSESQIDQRDRNDRALAQRIEQNAGHLARGSIESLPKYEREYLSSYMLEPDSFMDSYSRAAVLQGAGRTIR